MKERLKTVEYKKMTEEEQAFWDWWREIGGKQMEITPLDIWLAGIEWTRRQEKDLHDTPEV